MNVVVCKAGAKNGSIAVHFLFNSVYCFHVKCIQELHYIKDSVSLEI